MKQKRWQAVLIREMSVTTQEVRQSMCINSKLITSLMIVLLVMLPLTTVWSQANDYATYYVDRNNGSDRNLGTVNAPWRSIQHAIDTIQPGDTVIVRRGIYRIEQIHFGPAGEGFQHRTVFKAAPGERVFFTRPDGLPPHIQLEDFVRVEGFWFGGAWDRENGGLFHPGGSPIGVGKQIINNTIFGYRTGINIGASEHLLVQGNRLVHTGNGRYDHGIYMAGGGPDDGQRTNHIIVDRNVFVAGEGYGIHGWHHPKTTIITRNFVGRHYGGIVVGNRQAFEHLIANNIIWKVSPGLQLSGDYIYAVNNVLGPDTPMYSREQSNLTISNNVFFKPTENEIGGSPRRILGDNSITLERDQIETALGVSEDEIDAAIAALDKTFSQPVEVIYANTSIEAYFALLESLSSVADGPLDGQGIKWFDNGGAFSIGVNVPAPTSQEAFWQAFRELGLREYDRNGDIISNPAQTPP